MEKCSLSGTREFLGIQKSLLYFEVSITLYTYKNDTKFCHLSFGTDKTAICNAYTCPHTHPK